MTDPREPIRAALALLAGYIDDHAQDETKPHHLGILDAANRARPPLNVGDFHRAWGYAKDHASICADGYDKAAFRHVHFWLDAQGQSRSASPPDLLQEFSDAVEVGRKMFSADPARAATVMPAAPEEPPKKLPKGLLPETVWLMYRVASRNEKELRLEVAACAERIHNQRAEINRLALRPSPEPATGWGGPGPQDGGPGPARS